MPAVSDAAAHLCDTSVAAHMKMPAPAKATDAMREHALILADFASLKGLFSCSMGAFAHTSAADETEIAIMAAAERK
jgi:hypothetical protein